jgi:hypothetical protein
MSLHGSSEWHEQPGTESGWRTGTGSFTTRTFQGPTSTLNAFLRSLSQVGLNGYRKQSEGETTTVVAEYVAASPDSGITEEGLVENYWELDGNDGEKELWQHPDVVALLSKSTAVQVQRLRSVVDNIVSGKIGEDAADEARVAAETFGSYAIYEPLAQMIRRFMSGLEAMEYSQYVLRKTQVVLRNSSLKASHGNVGKQFRYQDLVQAEPTLLKENWVAAADLKHLNWVKKTPKGRPSTRGQWELTVEYWGAEVIDDWLHPYAVRSAQPKRPNPLI